MWSHLVLMIVLVMTTVIGLSCAVWQFVKQSRTQNRTGNEITFLKKVISLFVNNIKF